MNIYTIYKIIDNETKKCYIGSTKQKLKARIYRHHNKIGNHCSSSEIIDNNNYKVIVLLKVMCNKKTVLLLELFCIKNSYNTVNKINPVGLDKIKIKNRKKEYYQKHKERRKNQNKYRYSLNNKKCNCICGGKYTLSNKNAHNKTNKHKTFMEKIGG
jgi:hypothetical protein